MEPAIYVSLFFLASGLILLAISRYYRLRIEKMDADFTGDIIHDQESTDWYWYGRKINYQIMKATKYIGFLILIFPVIFLIALIVEWLSGSLYAEVVRLFPVQ